MAKHCHTNREAEKIKTSGLDLFAKICYKNIFQYHIFVVGMICIQYKTPDCLSFSVYVKIRPPSWILKRGGLETKRINFFLVFFSFFMTKKCYWIIGQLCGPYLIVLYKSKSLKYYPRNTHSHSEVNVPSIQGPVNIHYLLILAFEAKGLGSNICKKKMVQ